MKRIQTALVITGALYITPAQAFNFEEAAAIEGTFRRIVAHCADEATAKVFTEGSKAQVAFSLQGEDVIIPVELVEVLITDHAARPEIKELGAEECDSLLPRLMKLNKERSIALESTEVLTHSLLEASRNNSQPGL